MNGRRFKYIIMKFPYYIQSVAFGIVNVLLHSAYGSGFSLANFIASKGYDVEVHPNIQTEDNYLLDMFRIPHGLNNSHIPNKPAVLLMHGLLGSAENFVISGPKSALAFYLADEGYDVWLGNARGTFHSRKHTTLNPDVDGAFWQFSWHEIGIYDLPAKIDYILEETNQTQIYYIGHSQGTTTFYVMAAERPSYNARIKLMVSLAPSAFISHIPNLGLKLVAPFIFTINTFTDMMGVNEFVPNTELINFLGKAVCEERVVIREICANIIFLMAGYDSKQLDRDIVPLIMQTCPAGASTRQLYHYAQGIASGYFRQYDHGLVKNMRKYGQSSPPQYDLSKITAPMALYYSPYDLTVSPIDVKILASKLPNLVTNTELQHEDWSHLDFIFARDAVDLIYKEVNEVMKQFK